MHAPMKWTAILALAILTGLAPAAAKDPKAWKVQGKLLGEVDGNDVEKAKDVSGIACAPGVSLPRLCLIVDDETQGAQIVLLHKDSLTAGEFIRLTYGQYEGEPLELDAEAVAFDNNNFYVVGSHGRARHETHDASEEKKNTAKADASRFIFRVFLKPSQVDMTTGKLTDKPLISPPATLTGILQRLPDIAKAYDEPLAKNGLTIEGIDVKDKKLYVGMRGPVIGDKASVVSVGLAAVFDGAPPAPELHGLKLGTDKRGNVRGIRDIVRHGDGFLVLAGPVNDPEGDAVEDGDYAIYPWDGENQPGARADIKSFGKKVKPEALLPLEGDAQSARILVLFDGPKEGSPTPIDVEFK
jgi:hypothetical protein